jgi:hypothetical protein
LRIYGVDFTSAPRKAKPITVASAVLDRNSLHVEEIQEIEDFPGFEAFLQRPGPWIGGFDFPFSLPRELVRELGWPPRWKALVGHCAKMDRLELRRVLDAYRATRPAGSKYAHRATDYPAGSSSPMKLVNPPVALMFHEGARRLLAAGVHVPALALGDRKRVALEAYPGLLVRKQLGIRDSYKSDTRAEQTAARKAVRKRIVDALCAGRPLGIKLHVKAKSLDRGRLWRSSGCRDLRGAGGVGRAAYGLWPAGKGPGRRGLDRLGLGRRFLRRVLLDRHQLVALRAHAEVGQARFLEEGIGIGSVAVGPDDEAPCAVAQHHRAGGPVGPRAILRLAPGILAAGDGILLEHGGVGRDALADPLHRGAGGE